jgi:hypothetical protein
MNEARQPRIRYAETSLHALGIPQDSAMHVQQAHLHGYETLEDAVDVYRGVFGLSERATVQITSTPGRTVIGTGGDGIRLIKVPGNHRILSDEMVLHR